MFERFTDRARRVMGLANQEAMRFNHESIGTEHILLGLVKEGSGVAANVLRNIGVDLKRIRMDIEKKVPVGHELVHVGRLPFTPRAKKVIELAFEESRGFGHGYVGSEHLLLGLLRETEGVAAQVLVEQGLKLEEVRKEVLRLLGHDADSEGGSGKEGKTDQEKDTKSKTPAEASNAHREELRTLMEVLMGIEKSHEGKEDAPRATLCLTPRARKVIELAFEEARGLGHGFVDTEHLLLALLRETEVVSAQVLIQQGLTLERLRDEVLRRFESGGDGGK